VRPGTAFEQLTSRIIDKLSPGSSSVTKGYFAGKTFMAAAQKAVVVSMKNSQGLFYFSCGSSVVGSRDVCGP
jgi:hypothetical protein